MGYPRRLLVDSNSVGFYHCISRCVRRAFLCGDAWEHRRQWIEDRLVELHEIFAISSCAYSILSNHLHLVLKIDPQQAQQWSDLEVARRWTRLYPGGLERATRNATNPREKEQLARQYLADLVAQQSMIRLWRKRLADISWFNKALKEPISRRANREDGCTGHFWEGRFRSYRLLDEAAVLACMVYVDLNPFRAGMAAKLRDCAFTSILQRMKVVGTNRTSDHRAEPKGDVPQQRRKRRGVPLIPIESLFRTSTAKYVSLVARTGGLPIDSEAHTDRLASLGIDPKRWQAVMNSTARLIGTAVGSAVNLVKEAGRRGASRVVNPIDVYAT